MLRRFFTIGSFFECHSQRLLPGHSRSSRRFLGHCVFSYLNCILTFGQVRNLIVKKDIMHKGINITKIVDKPPQRFPLFISLTAPRLRKVAISKNAKGTTKIFIFLAQSLSVNIPIPEARTKTNGKAITP